MIIDTSALIAILRNEIGAEQLLAAIMAEGGSITAPTLVEYERVTSLADNRPNVGAREMLDALLSGGVAVSPFTAEMGREAAAANERYGTGNGRGGTLNLFDLIVYGASIALDEPILCTGRDFAATDARIHPASRLA